MSFFNETLLKLGCSAEDSIGGDKVTLIGGEGCQIEGQKGVAHISLEKIAIKTSKHIICIEGEGLQIVSINGDEALIVGKIASITRTKKCTNI
ncbi:MAG: YabP/YqfC family sporulation protein [Bacillota bacterium]